jgi:hypothetical protein
MRRKERFSMKNKKTNAANILRLLGIIALVAVIGFSTASCFIIPDDDDDYGGGGGSGSCGKFTLTGIPSAYNGKYATFHQNTVKSPDVIYEMGLYGFKSDPHNVSDYLFLISNGSVSIDMWIYENQHIGGFVRYSGSDTTKENVRVSIDHESLYILFDPVTFSKGSATRSWSQGRVTN